MGEGADSFMLSAQWEAEEGQARQPAERSTPSTTTRIHSRLPVCPLTAQKCNCLIEEEVGGWAGVAAQGMVKNAIYEGSRNACLF